MSANSSASVVPGVRMIVPTDLERIRAARKCVEGLLVSEGWGETDTADVGLVATELLQNAIEHGSRCDGREAVVLAMTVDEAGRVTIDVTDPDTGKGFAALIGRDVTVAPPIDAARGRGLFLVNRIAKLLERRRGAGGGSMVRVRLEPTEPLARRGV